MNSQLKINATTHEIEITPGETLFSVIRRLGFYGIKFGDEDGLTGSDTVLLDGKPVNAGSLLAAQAEGHNMVGNVLSSWAILPPIFGSSSER